MRPSTPIFCCVICATAVSASRWWCAAQARDRMEYLLRPDLGRTLDAASRELLAERASAILLLPTRRRDCGWAVGGGGAAARDPAAASDAAGTGRPFVVAKPARVALGDAIAQMLGADVVIRAPIGERPGLSSPHSLGAYLTWAPRIGCTDAERNCISSIRPEGLPCRSRPAADLAVR